MIFPVELEVCFLYLQFVILLSICVSYLKGGRAAGVSRHTLHATSNPNYLEGFGLRFSFDRLKHLRKGARQHRV